MRIDENKIFDAYMNSLLVEKKKKGLPPWLKDKKEEKGSDKKDAKDSKKKDKKEKKLPPWLKKKGKKVIKEDHETFPEDVTGITVSELLDELQGTDPELYRRIEDYLKGEGSAERTSVGADDFNELDFNDDIDETEGM